jgi:O-Antigen ligase
LADGFFPDFEADMAPRSIATNSRSAAADFASEGAVARAGIAFSAMTSGLALACFFSRFFLPTESAAQGDTLWIVALWMLCGLMFLAGGGPGVARLRRMDWLNASLALWIGGQIASAISVVATLGDKRAAVNMAWEWFGLGIVWLVVRHGCEDHSFRRGLVRAMIVTGAVLGVLGLWQHYVSQPQAVAEYGPLFDRLRRASPSEATAIQLKLAREGIPTDDPALTLFEKRLRDSREPLGLFALANTFGGCLAGWLILALGEILAVRRRGSHWSELVPLLVCVGVIAWCLLLTKSRTAWIGTMCGVVVLIATRMNLTLGRRGLLFGGLGVAGLGVVLALLFQFGGLDRQVLSEAPKSLSYRLQYWQATRQMIADHFLMGVGPGNFRQHYLRYKLPEASEEILDPHNLFFDAAANGGIVSLAGLLGFLGLVALVGLKHRRKVVAESGADASANSLPVESRISNSLLWCAGLGIPLAFFGLLFLGGQWEDRLLILAVAWSAVAGCLCLSRRVSYNGGESERIETGGTALAACVTLVVHLCGAGGIAMPAVSQMLLALAALSLVVPSDAPRKTARDDGRRSPIAWLAVVGLGLTAVGFAITALVPVSRCQFWERTASAALFTGGSDARAVADAGFQSASLADPWSAQPWRRRFELIDMEKAVRSNESFEAVVRLLDAAVERDPLNFWGQRAQGNLWLAKWKLTSNREDARRAAEWFRRAVVLYPTNVSLWADLSAALEAGEEPAAAVEAAQRALAQDEIYRQNGHVDRYLTDRVKSRLESLLGKSSR